MQGYNSPSSQTCGINVELKKEIINNLKNLYEEIANDRFSCCSFCEGQPDVGGKLEADRLKYLRKEVAVNECKCSYKKINKEEEISPTQTLNGENALPYGVDRNYVTGDSYQSSNITQKEASRSCLCGAVLVTEEYVECSTCSEKYPYDCAGLSIEIRNEVDQNYLSQIQSETNGGTDRGSQIDQFISKEKLKSNLLLEGNNCFDKTDNIIENINKLSENVESIKNDIAKLISSNEENACKVDNICKMILCIHEKNDDLARSVSEITNKLDIITGLLQNAMRKVDNLLTAKSNYVSNTNISNKKPSHLPAKSKPVSPPVVKIENDKVGKRLDPKKPEWKKPPKKSSGPEGKEQQIIRAGVKSKKEPTDKKAGGPLGECESESNSSKNPRAALNFKSPSTIEDTSNNKRQKSESTNKNKFVKNVKFEKKQEIPKDVKRIPPKKEEVTPTKVKSKSSITSSISKNKKYIANDDKADFKNSNIICGEVNDKITTQTAIDVFDLDRTTNKSFEVINSVSETESKPPIQLTDGISDKTMCICTSMKDLEITIPEVTNYNTNTENTTKQMGGETEEMSQQPRQEGTVQIGKSDIYRNRSCNVLEKDGKYQVVGSKLQIMVVKKDGEGSIKSKENSNN